MHGLVDGQCQAWQAGEIGREQQDSEAAAYAMPGDQRRQPDKQSRAGDKRRHDIDLELMARLVDNILCPLKLSGDAVTLQRRSDAKRATSTTSSALMMGVTPSAKIETRSPINAEPKFANAAWSMPANKFANAVWSMPASGRWVPRR